MTEFQLDVLGALRLCRADGAEVRVASRKARALLGYLALRPLEAQSRDRLAALLWEDVDTEQARASLRQALAGLRRLTGEHALIRADAETMQLSPGVRVDVTDFRAASATGTRESLQRAAALYRGDLLEGFDARSGAFEDAVQAERLTLRNEASTSLSRLIKLCTQDEDFDAAIQAARRLTTVEPLNEAAHRALMELYARRQLYTEALRQYRQCRDALRRELDVAPEPATEALYRELMRKRRAAGIADTGEVPVLDEAQAAAAIEDTSARLLRPGLRDAVVLVTRLDGLQQMEALLDPEETRALALSYQARVRDAMREFGGQTDDRLGPSIVSVFGLPHSQGNEAERAVRAALYLRDQLTRQPLRSSQELHLHVGIAQGQVLRSPNESLFPLAGPPVHRAHALASAAARSQIAVANELRDALGERIRADAIEPAHAQGVNGWELRALHVIDAATTPRFFVGRRPELAMLTAGLERCLASGHGRAMIVRGEAGIGKTRLVEALRSQARERGFGVHCVQIFDFGQKAIRRPLATLTFSLLGLTPDATTADRAAGVAALAGSSDETIFLSELIDAPLPDDLAALAQAMPAARRARGIDEALGKLLRAACATAPQLITLEDLHWASAEEIERIAAWLTDLAATPTLLIATTRPEGERAGTLIKAGGRRCPVTTLDLAPMADDEAHELAAHYCHLVPETIDACIQRAEGFPLFLDQLLRAASANPHALPSSIRSLVVARADRLQPHDLTALHAAAVLGQRCELDALRAVTGIDTYESEGLFDTGLLRHEGHELEFAHALFRDAVYQSIVRSERRELHALAAEWFQGRELLLYADHLAGAEDGRAAAAYIDAARAERRAHRVERALEVVRKAQGLAPTAAILHTATCLVGEMCLQVGRTHLALTAFRESLEAADTPLAQVESWIGVASALRIMDRYQEAIEALDTAESKLDGHASAQLKVRLWTLRGNLYFPLGRVEECLQAHARAHEFAVAANSPLDMARADGGLCDAWYQRGRMLTARKHVLRCIEAARKHQLQGILLSYLPMLAVIQAYCGEFRAALVTNEESLSLARRIGDQRGELLTQLTTATVLFVTGEPERCIERARQTQALARQLGARRFEAESMGTHAGVCLALGQREEALQLIRSAIDLSRATGMTYCGPVLLGVLARATTDDAEREAALAEAEQLLAAGCVSHSYFDFYTGAIDASLQQQRWGEARRYAAALAQYTAEEPTPWSSAVVHRGIALARIGEEGPSRSSAAELKSLRELFARMPAKPLIDAIDAAIVRCEQAAVA
ncbi:MAG TPA: BREX system ATP-binding domain-containing protein [Steroidobacteraceae bacterium]|nr:BREX system ATP-binding domain-containing protein [Steroidobacteraceae bacterium]